MSRTVLFSASPAPPPAPLPAEPARVVHVHGPSASTWVAVALGLILAVGGGYVLRPGHAPPPNPTPVLSPLASAARDYMRTLPSAYRDAEEKVRSKSITTKAGLTNALKDHARPLSSVINSTVDAWCDKEGNITNVDAVARALGETAKALGSK